MSDQSVPEFHDIPYCHKCSSVNGALGIFAGNSKVTFPLPYQSPYTPAR